MSIALLSRLFFFGVVRGYTHFLNVLSKDEMRLTACDHRDFNVPHNKNEWCLATNKQCHTKKHLAVYVIFK